MEAINTFSSGMNSDQSKTILNKETYLQALNFRPLTELGASNGSLVNIKGNECTMSFPNVSSVYKIQVFPGNDPATTSNTYSITINGTTITGVSINNNTTGFDLYNIIINGFPNCASYTGTTPDTFTFDIAYDNDYIVLYQQPTYSNCDAVDAVDVTVTLTPTTTSATNPLLYFVNKGSGNPGNTLTQNTQYPFARGYAGSELVVIGSTFILNDIYLLTCPKYSASDPPIPNDELANPGTIWRLNIDDITKAHTLTLVYHSRLDFTNFHPIPPSAITGRYESKEIQRIYWSDNFNKVRVLNCTLPQLMALDPTQLNVMPKVEYTQAILAGLNDTGGSLPAGCYQLGYRLSKVLGTVTNFSELSNPVYLTVNAESTAFELYEGALGNTSKQITWKLTGLDMNFDQIEPVIVYRTTPTSVATITSMGLTTLTEDMSITYSNPNSTANSNITLDEFLLFNGTFTHAKTCDTKDNRLFWGNVRAPRKDLEDYDARAFRARNDGKIVLTNGGVAGTIWQFNNPFAPAYAPSLPQTEDTINEYYDPATGDYSPNACYLKPTNLNRLGGEGINISYEFATQSIQTDNDLSISTTDGYDISRTGAPFRTNDTTSTPINLNYEYPQNGRYQALKQPERTSLLRGFQHEEIYRFGIQFFDREGNPYFTKWIGDIKMPTYGDLNDNPDTIALAYFTGAGAPPDFRLSFNADQSHQYMQVLCVKFTVNVDSIKDLISGYQIVRVKREGNNRTIWGSGMVNPFVSENGSNGGGTAMIPAGWDSKTGSFGVPFSGGFVPRRYYTPNPDQWSVETLNVGNDDFSQSSFARFKMFDSWDFDAGFRPSFAKGDKILVRSRLYCVNYFNNGGNAGYRKFFFTKNGTYGSSADYPSVLQRIDLTLAPPFLTNTNNDMGSANSSGEPFFIMKMTDEGTLYAKYGDFSAPNFTHDYKIEYGTFMGGNTDMLYSTYTIKNYGDDAHTGSTAKTDRPSCGKPTTFLDFQSELYTTGTYGITANDAYFKKLLALYYRPNNSLYNGATYVARTTNEYIPCGEYISIIQNDLFIPAHINNYTLNCFGGDVFSVVYDMMKTVKPSGAAAKYYIYQYNGSGVFVPAGGAQAPFAERDAKFSTTFFFPCTVRTNVELRMGNHTNRSLSSDAGYGQDDIALNDYCSLENDVKTYYPKPLNFQTADEWINRIYWSEIKFNNETSDSWSQYLTNNFYDVEGNYGGINALVSLREKMYYIQERGVGELMINPVSLITDNQGQPIKLGGGGGTDIIQKHYYKAIDTGTYHQWSVYRSQSAISFVDARHKKIYLFNGESVSPVSDVKGQRNFVIKRLHDSLLTTDNPVIGQGILTTYDYYHNEFLYTFINNNGLSDAALHKNENLTLAYSEIIGAFSGMYSFCPNIYINSNKYLLTTQLKENTVGDRVKLWFHNYGPYTNFYNVKYPSTLKLLVNDNPLYTKVFDNMTIVSEAVNDVIEYSDDLNIYPGSPSLIGYPDDINIADSTFDSIRCYNQYQNTDWTTLSITPPNNIRKVEQGFNLQLPRNKFDYDTNAASTSSLFDPAKLTKTTFGERLRDKWLIADLNYSNSSGLRFVIHSIKTLLRISDR